jgi:hypothetical protein
MNAISFKIFGLYFTISTVKPLTKDDVSATVAKILGIAK